MGLKAGLSCPSLLQNLCAWLWKAVTRHKMTRSLPRELRCWRNGRLKGLRPGTITGRTRETRHDLGTDTEGKGKHCSAGPERCSPRRKEKSVFPSADVHAEGAEGFRAVAWVSLVARLGMFSLPVLRCCWAALRV